MGNVTLRGVDAANEPWASRSITIWFYRHVARAGVLCAALFVKVFVGLRLTQFLRHT